MKIYHCDHFVLPLPEDHRFPMAKYSVLRQRILESELSREHDLLVPPAATDEQLTRVHDATYIERVKNGSLSENDVRRIGFPWSPQLVERSRRSAGATIAASAAALQDGLAVSLAGGTHHASRRRGEGFCVFNDAAVAARAMQAAVQDLKVLIVDCDVHQGNGTASIFAGDPTVYTFSIHGANNFPFRKARSDLDVPLPDGTGDSDYLRALADGLDAALAKSRPRLAIYLAGADPYEDDTLGRLALTKNGLAQRERLVFEKCLEAGTGVATVMGGGYASDIDDIVDIHLATVQLAAEFSVKVRNPLEIRD